MYRIDRNNFYNEQKSATVYTPSSVSKFLFELLASKTEGLVVDPCVGAGSLLAPFQDAGFETLGIDIEYQGWPHTHICNFLSVNKEICRTPGLVIANPPFNIDAKTQELAGKIAGARPLLPEVWLWKIVELWGAGIPICLFAPYGLRLNQTIKSSRWQRFTDGTYPPISSIISLPKDIFPSVLFHSEILIFNRPDLQGHYFFSGQ